MEITIIVKENMPFMIWNCKDISAICSQGADTN